MTLKVYAFTTGWITLPLGGFLEGEHGNLEARSRRTSSGTRRETCCSTPACTCRCRPMHARGWARCRPARRSLRARRGDLRAAREGRRRLEGHRRHRELAPALRPLGRQRAVPRRARRGAEEGVGGRARRGPRRPHNGYIPDDYDQGHDVQTVDGEHDVFGDGSVVCVPTPGHTPGHQSLKLRGKRCEHLLCGDACSCAAISTRCARRRSRTTARACSRRWSGFRRCALAA